MKKHLTNKLLWQSLLSTIVLGTIIIIAVGSLGASAEETKKDLGGGMIEKTIVYTFWDGGTETYTGKENEHGIRNGLWIIVSKNADGTIDLKEEVTYVNGIRTGISKTTESDGYIKYECYRNGRVYPCTKSKNVIAEDATAFHVLAQRYPWFTNKLLIFGFDNEYVEAVSYTHLTLPTILLV